MKNTYTFLLAIFSLALLSPKANAQEIGIRGGDLSGGNIGLDAVVLTSEFTRVHTDVSFGENIGIDLLWDFVYRPLGNGDFNLYAGVGAFTLFTDPITAGAVGEIGFEYRFPSVPIALGIDWRPLYSIVEENKFIPEGFGFNVRYILDFY